MKNQDFPLRKIILFSLALILAVIYAFQLAFSHNTNVKDITISEEIDSLVIQSQNQTVHLTKKGDTWFVETFVADSALVSSLVSEMSNIKLLGLITRNSDSKAHYGLDESEKIGVCAYASQKELRRLTIGKNASTGNQCYVQVDNKPEIYLENSGLHDLFSVTVDSLRSLDVYSIVASEIKEVSVESQDGKFTLKRLESDSNSEWNLIENTTSVEYTALDFAKVNSWVNSLASLRASSWLNEESKENQNEKHFTIILRNVEKTIKITIFEKDSEEDAICLCSETPYQFSISDFVSQKFQKSLSDLQSEVK